MAYRTINKPLKLEYIDGFDPEKYLANKIYEDQPIWTGLYDKDGKSIYKVTDPIGFIRKDGNDG